MQHKRVCSPIVQSDECRYAPLNGHPVDLVAQSIARDTKVLCLDELHVTDVADALILGQVSLLRSVFCLHTRHTADTDLS